MPIPYLNRFSTNGLIPLKHKKALPVGTKRPETLAEQVARLVRHSEFARMVNARGLETFEEADDFEVDDDIPLPDTPWEKDFDLPAVAAMNHGVVQAPSVEEMSKARDILSRFKASKKAKSSSSATTPATEAGSATGDPHISEGDEPALPSPKPKSKK